MNCKLCSCKRNEGGVRLDGIEIQSQVFGLYPPFGEVDEDLTHGIKARRLEWISLKDVLCQLNISYKVKRKALQNGGEASLAVWK